MAVLAGAFLIPCARAQLAPEIGAAGKAREAWVAVRKRRSRDAELESGVCRASAGVAGGTQVTLRVLEQEKTSPVCSSAESRRCPAGDHRRLWMGSLDASETRP